MRIIDAFLGEHAIFYAQFNHLKQTVPHAETLAQVKSQAAMLAAALASHANLEEELLFTILEPRIGPMGPLAVMRMEHEKIEQILEHLPDVSDLEQASQLLLQCIEIAREHFAKEEQILYRMAVQTLPPETLVELGAQWAARRAVTLV